MYSEKGATGHGGSGVRRTLFTYKSLTPVVDGQTDARTKTTKNTI